MKQSERPKKVAVIMSAYNHEAYVAEALESVCRQTYPHWELFVADDASPDRTAEIIASFCDERIHFYPLKENTQLAGAWEMLTDKIDPSAFAYIQTLASDDVLYPDKFEKQIAFLEEHPEYAACFAWAEVIDKEGRPDPGNVYFNLEPSTRYEWLKRFFLQGNLVNCNAALTRCDAYFETGTMNQRFLMLADFRLWHRIAARYPVYLMQEKLIHYRMHGKNLSRFTLQSAIGLMNESVRMMKEILFPMDGYTFRRAYYPLLAYRRFETEAEEAAAKFIMLMNSGFSDKCQLAIELYLEHADDRAFFRVLREKYGFESRDFTGLKQNNGLAYAANDIARRSGIKEYLPQEDGKTCHAWQLLTDAVKAGGFTADTFGDFTYAALQQLSALRHEGEEWVSLFETIKSLCGNLRGIRSAERKERRVLFLVASDSDWRLNRDNTPVLPDDKTVYYVAYVNPADVQRALDLRALVEEDIAAGTDLDGIQYIDLFDEDNQALLFADDVIEGLTDICFVDCMRDGYETALMVTGYPLAISLTCVMEKADYDVMVQKDGDRLQLFDAVYYY